MNETGVSTLTFALFKLKGAAANPVAGPDGIVYSGWVNFLESFAIPNADIFNL
jgi:thiosulfate dehydrogenase (quinone) large subunit